MRISRLVTRTLRDDPPEAETASHRLMLRAGLIQQVAAGVYAYLPLAWRSLQKIEQIVREEMDAAAGQELRMPALQPLELWQQTDRDAAFGDNMFRLEDRRGRPLALAPTHEEVVTNIVKGNVQSYRDLPVILYQMQTKFRDEPRPRAGLVRVREFTMKDAYSFDADDNGLDDSYQAMAQAYRNVFRRCSIPVVMAEADSGAIGGKDSHEFLLPTDTGEDTVITCSRCGYAANAEKAEGVYPNLETPDPLPLEEVATPGIKTIATLAKFLGITEAQTLKAVFYSADGEVVFVTIRGDLDVNEIKLKNALHCNELRLADDDEVAAAGLVAGSASAIGLTGIRKIADPSISNGGNFVVGANNPDTHYRNANYPRDFDADIITDIALTKPGHRCAQCGATLASTRGVEVGHIFKLGTFFSEALGAYYLDTDGQQQPITMGCYGIGVSRILAASIEQNHDERGIVFPPPIAPYQVHLVGLNMSDDAVAEAAGDLYGRLWAAGIETLFDDRTDAAAGVKFNDADLMGLPVRLVVSPRNLRQSAVEMRGRTDDEAKMVGLDEVVGAVQGMYVGEGATLTGTAPVIPAFVEMVEGQNKSAVDIYQPDQIHEYRQMVRNQARRARDVLNRLDQNGMEVLYDLKFYDRGYHPLQKNRRWNFIEQLNQTFHSMAVLAAAEKLLAWHDNCEGLHLELTTGQGIDVGSIARDIVNAEVFAAKTPGHNGRLKDNVERLKASNAANRYVFFFCPGYPKGRQCELEQRYQSNEIQIWALSQAEVM